MDPGGQIQNYNGKMRYYSKFSIPSKL